MPSRCTAARRGPLRSTTAVLACLLAIACSQPADDTADSDGATATTQVLKRGNRNEPGTLDPHRMSSIHEDTLLGDLYLGLTTHAADGSIIPGAAQSWKISPDGRTYTFSLREDLRWSDGVLVTARDFVFALRRLFDPATAAPFASVLYVIQNSRAVNLGQQPKESIGVTAIDDFRLEFRLDHPAPYFLELLAHNTAYPLPAHVFAKQPDRPFALREIVTNGPYRMAEWVPHEYIRLMANQHFYDRDQLAIKQVLYYPTDDAHLALRRFRGGEIDLNTDIPSNMTAQLQTSLPVQTRITPALGVVYYVFNTSKPPFDSPAVRRALSMAIDRRFLADHILGPGERAAFGLVPPDLWGDLAQSPGGEDARAPIEQRRAEARRLLAQAGYSQTAPLKTTLSYFTHETYRRVAVAVASMWSQVGVRVELFNTDRNVHFTDLQQRNFQVAHAAWVADVADPYTFLFMFTSDAGALNETGYSSAEFDALFTRSNHELDPTERLGLLRKAEQTLLADQPLVPLFFMPSKNLVGAHVKGWVDNLRDKHRTRFLRIEADTDG